MPTNPMNNDNQIYQLLYVAQLDLSQAAFFADYLLEQGWHFEPWEIDWREYLKQGAFVTAMVVAYSRPFTDSRGWPKFPKRLLRGYSQKQKDLHQRLLGLRNEVYAHSDIGSRKIRPIISRGKPSAIEALPPMRFDAPELRAIRELIYTVSMEIGGKLEELSDNVASET